MAVAVLILPVASVVALFYSTLSGDDTSPRARAVIVDQLAATDPNPSFVTNATRMLETAGYEVDYVGPESVSVAFYRALPRLGFDLIILRSHAAAFSSDRNESDLSETRGVSLFTNESYSSRQYVEEQRNGLLSRARYADILEGEAFFAVDARSVASLMEGSFGGATIVLMGCAGLRTDTLAAAFYARGAKRFISWDDDVTASYTDSATSRFLDHLLASDGSVDFAVELTMNELGPDPFYGARLLAYP